MSIGPECCGHPELRDFGVASPLRRQEGAVMDFLSAHAIPSVDLFEDYNSAFARPQDAWVASDDPHPNPKAHRLIAEKLLQRISN